MLYYFFNNRDEAESANTEILSAIKLSDPSVTADRWSDIIESDGKYLIHIPTEYGLNYPYKKLDYVQPEINE